MKTKFLILLTTIAVLAFTIYQEHRILPSSNIGFVTNNTSTISSNFKNTVPNFSYNIFNHKESDQLYNLKADKIYVHFWATWCGVCAKEFKDIITFAKANSNTKILVISIDDDPADLQKFIIKLNKQYNINKLSNLIFIWDENRSISLEWSNTTMVPETYILDKDYKFLKKIIGRSNWK
ncbi:MAG: TlpA family protein disulfide reductase [Gammaproteobacteria bacterium]|nr:TlpA family protein disulfide reductase [Gammaproteobacteria bacterium]